MDLYSDNDSYDYDEEDPQFMEHSFREAAYTDSSGISYITNAQLSFYLNRPNGVASFEQESEDFLTYESECVLYNLLYDVSESGNENGYLFWNPELEAVDAWFPRHGKVENLLESIGMTVEEPKDEDPK